MWNEKPLNEDCSLREFLATFKTLPCYNSACSPDQCMNYHSDFDKRRNPYQNHTIIYRLQYCADNCGDQKCPKCHSKLEFDFHPLNYMSEKCPLYYNCPATFCPRLHDYDAYQDKDYFFRFDLATFKTQPCTLNYSHDVKICLYYHHKMDRRRPSQSYQHVMCERPNNCQLEDACPYAHNKIEQLYHPSRYKSKFCDKYPYNIQQCQYRNYCSFAHTPNQITIPLIHLYPQTKSFFINHYKTVWCPNTNQHERNRCVYAHNIQDFRRNPNDYKYSAESCPYWKTAENIKSIEQAGCKDMMQCKKCHGRKQLQYHPLVYKPKNQKHIQFTSGFTKEKIIQKLENKGKEEPSEKQKPEPVTASQIFMTTSSNNSTLIGAPFFQNYDTRSVSSKTTRAKSGGTSSCTESHKHKKRKESVDSSSSSKPQYSVKHSYHQIYGSDETDKELFQVFQRPPRLSQHCTQKKHQRARSENERVKDFRLYYSEQMTSLFEDTNILEKLACRKISQVKILNMSDKDILSLCWLSSAEKSILLQRLRELQNSSVHYSAELHQHFKRFNKLDILEKLKQKKVREKKLLSMQNQEIQLLSFIEDDDKKVLPIIIKDFMDNQEFFDLSTMIERVVSDDTIFQ